ncbi:MAG: 2-amino-4-hydroxy-6-hydroxymethyldihydropteridine diphosphokinase [Elusimicrobiales bacterium]|nr:2-amino-4-hydroxy-6-hydroxymethyldihydropteridine diphosphokinase [Elusimicrobiales bacterium]HOL62137.1 2-amino-4-hydroxy-6-hydroxymethyldihydropteridine diphosphokinase [Elusimicrobiales bacterium]HPO95984.1 2-amino-4-hydroxy-6-hydroxymethyldihydropteridine diphosphokinase [Elusimicrobiales bacterium]
MIAFISIGSNIGDRIKNIKNAIRAISKKNKVLSVSKFYITKPMYYESQPYFINGAIKIETDLSPDELLVFLNDIEKKLGRKRIFKNSPRTIDLDIIYYGNKVINRDNLKIPHPKLYERAFVLAPMNDVAKNFKDPLKNKKVCELLLNLDFDNKDILRVPDEYGEVYSFLNNISLRKREDFKTDYIKKTLDVIGNPQTKIGRVIHITGSCGKTSTAKYINDLLKGSGYNVCLYTSPHIKDLRERIMIDSKMISKASFYKNLINIISKAEILHSPFEYITLIALSEFSRKTPDFSVIEVGMGGENDATNVFDYSYSVFTTVTSEHKKYLGNSLKKIVLNKSGIIKNKGKVFVSSTNKLEAIKILKEKAKRKNCEFYLFPRQKNSDFDFINKEFSKFIVSNICELKESKLKNFDCRKQSIKYKNSEILIDGAHTPLSVKMLLKSLSKDYKACLCGFMRDKEIKKMIQIIKKEGFRIYLAPSYAPRSFDPFEFKKYGIVFKDLRLALDKIIKKEKKLVVTGSLYFCSDVIKIIENKKIEYFKELL